MRDFCDKGIEWNNNFKRGENVFKWKYNLLVYKKNDKYLHNFAPFQNV